MRKQRTFPDGKAKGQYRPKRALTVSPDTDAKRQRAALSKQLDMRRPERLCRVVDENEMNVVGRQAIGSRPPDGACGVGSPRDSDKIASWSSPKNGVNANKYRTFSTSKLAERGGDS
jgi:hypothetical protein